MLKSESKSAPGTPSADRRAYPRLPVRSLAYIELDEDNAGLILNISEGGIGVQSAEMITGDRFQRMILRLPKLEKWIEAGGKLSWISPSRKEAGIQFVALGDEARQEIQNWIDSSSLRPGVPIDHGHFKIVWESQEPEISTVLPAPKDDLVDIDAMFPSEKEVPPTRHARVDNHTSPAASPASSVESGIAPGPVKRRILIPPPEATIPEQSSAANVTPSPETRVANDPPEPVRHSYHYPPLSLDSKPSGDPFAVIAQETSAVGGSLSAEATARNNVTDIHSATAPHQPVAPAFPLREHYRGLGYNPAPFEEPSGKGWLIAAAILIIFLVGGTVLALGPNNVKSGLGRHLPLISADGPPPPSGSMEKSPEPAVNTESANDPASSDSFGGPPQQPLTNPGVAASQESDTATAQTPPQVEAPPTVATVTGKASAKPSANTTDARIVEGRDEPAPVPNQEDAATITRRFQMEHSLDNPRNVPNSYPAPLYQAPSPASTQNPSVSAAPQTKPDRATDTYPQAPPASPASTPLSSSSSPAGTVAVSSHFRSLRGEEPESTRERHGLNVGQLISIHQPAYPVEAERSRTQGIVELRATVDQLGKVEIVHAVSGPPLLLAAAVDAVREWRYAPTTVNGKAVESLNDVTVVFRLGNSAASPR